MGYFWDTFEILSGYFVDTFRILLGYFWDTLGIILGYFLNTFGGESPVHLTTFIIVLFIFNVYKRSGQVYICLHPVFCCHGNNIVRGANKFDIR